MIEAFEQAAPLERRQLHFFYNEALLQWPVDFIEKTIQTRVGATHLVISGSDDLPPVFLLHPMGGNATFWEGIVKPLTLHHRVYAVDTIGDLGKSRLRETSKPTDGRDYAIWLCEVMDSLGIDVADFVGASYGAWVAHNLALFAPERVGRLVLLSPVGGLCEVSRKVAISLSLLSVFPSWSYLKLLARWLLGSRAARSENVLRHLELLMNERAIWFVRPDRFSEAEVHSIDIPTLLLLGTEDSTYSQLGTMVKRARRLVRDLELGWIPSAGHLLSLDQPRLAAERILKFLATSRWPSLPHRGEQLNPKVGDSFAYEGSPG